VQEWIRNAAGSGEITSRELPGGAALSTFVPEGRTAGEVVLDVEDLVVRRGRRLVIGEETGDGSVEGLSLTLRENEWGVLKAPNGWGKTTLLEVIAGTLPATRGTVRLRGKALQDMPAWERDVSLLQSRDHIFPTLSVREALRLSEVREVPAYVDPLLDRKMSSLSGGEKQKASLACALNGKAASTRLLDEPFSALDAPTIQSLTRVLTTDETPNCTLFATPGTDREDLP
jgi:ABC-type multidrug transport system ATPase subunit